MHIPALIQYLAGLEENNNKAWFVMNKPSYDILRAEFTVLVDQVISGIARFDPAVVGVEARKALFRIHRDVRFSNDKTPYKPHFSAAISGGGRKSSAPMYYLQINHAGHLLVAAGCYLPEKERLAKIRAAVAADPKGFEKVVRGKKFRETFGELSGHDKLARAPKGYAPDAEGIERIKLKSFIARHDTDLNAALPDDLAAEIVATCKAAYPLVTWLRAADEA